MKTFVPFRNALPVLLIAVLFTTSCSQRLYRNSRVRIDVEHQKTAPATGKSDILEPGFVTSGLLTDEKEAVEQQKEDVSVATIKGTDAVRQVKRKTFIEKTAVKEKKTLKGLSFPTYAEKVKMAERLLKVQDVERTALLGWLVALIVFLIGFAIFLTLALLFLYVFANVVGYGIGFMIAAAVLAVLAIIFLIAGLAGVFG